MNKVLFPVICLTLSTYIVKLFIKWRYEKRLQEDNNSQYYHQCKFINMNQFNCRPHLLEGTQCCEDCASVYEKEILSFISSAKLSICMCMYMISLKEVISALIKASKRKVKVQVITDKVMLKTEVIQRNMKRLEEKGK